MHLSLQKFVQKYAHFEYRDMLIVTGVICVRLRHDISAVGMWPKQIKEWKGTQ